MLTNYLGYYSGFDRVKSLEKRKLIFKSNTIDFIWMLISVVLIVFLFLFGSLMIYHMYLKELYGLIPLFFVVLLLPFLGMLVPSRLKKIEFSRRNKALIKQYFEEKDYYFIVKKPDVLVVHPRHRFLSFRSPTIVAIVYDQKDTYINCSTFYSMYKIYAKMRVLPFFFLDKKHEKRIARELSEYIEQK